MSCSCSHGCEAEISLICGDDYKAVDDRALCFTEMCGSTWPENIDEVTLNISSACDCGVSMAIVGTLTTGTPSKVCFDLTSKQTHSFRPMKRGYRYSLRAKLASGSIYTIAQGTLTVLKP